MADPRMKNPSSSLNSNQALPNVGKFANYECVEFEYADPLPKDPSRKNKSKEIKKIPFQQMPAQQALSQLGCEHKASDPLSYYRDVKGDLSHAFKQKNSPKSSSKQTASSNIILQSFSDPKDLNQSLKIPVERMEILHQSAKVYLNANIFPSKEAYLAVLGKLKSQDKSCEKESLEMWMLLSTGICHVQEIDFYVDYQIQNGNAVAVPRTGEIKTHDNTILLVSSPSINFRLLQKLEKEDPNNLYFLGKDKMQIYMQEFFRNQLQAVKDSGRRTYYMLAAGLGPFLPNDAEIFSGSQIPVQKDIAKAYFQALISVAKEYPELNIIYNPSAFRKQYQEVLAGNSVSNIEVTSQDIYALAVDAQKRGEKVALSNSSDQDPMLGVFDLGQYWKQGHVAAEEVLGKFTSCSLGSYGLNKMPFLNAEFRHAGNIKNNRLDDLKKKTNYSNQKFLYEIRRLVENQALWEGETSKFKSKPKVIAKVENILNSNLTENEKIEKIINYVQEREEGQEARSGKKGNAISSSVKIANKTASEKTRLFMKCILRKNFKEFKKNYQVGVPVTEFSYSAQAAADAAVPASVSTATTSIKSSGLPMTTASPVANMFSSTAVMSVSDSSSSKDEKENEKEISDGVTSNSTPTLMLKSDHFMQEDDERVNIINELQKQYEAIKAVRRDIQQLHQQTYSKPEITNVPGGSLFHSSSTNVKNNSLETIYLRLQKLNAETHAALISVEDQAEAKRWINQLSELAKSPAALLQEVLSAFNFIIYNSGDVSNRSLEYQNIFIELYALREKADISLTSYIGVLSQLLEHYEKIFSPEGDFLEARLFLLQTKNGETKDALTSMQDQKEAEKWIGMVSELMKSPDDLLKLVHEAFYFILDCGGNVSNRSLEQKNVFVELYALREKSGTSVSSYVELLNQLKEIYEKKFAESQKNAF